LTPPCSPRSATSRHRLRYPARVGIPQPRRQVLIDRNLPQPLQVHPVRQPLPSDRRPRLRQPQRQPPQLLRHRPRPRHVAQPGPPRLERQPLTLAEHPHRHRRAPHPRQRLRCGYHHPRLARSRHEPAHHAQVSRVIEHQQAQGAVGLQGRAAVQESVISEAAGLVSDGRSRVSAADRGATSWAPLGCGASGTMLRSKRDNREGGEGTRPGERGRCWWPVGSGLGHQPSQHQPGTQCQAASTWPRPAGGLPVGAGADESSLQVHGAGC
jgi:hypothetical protein